MNEDQFSSSVAKLVHHSMVQPLYPLTLQLVPTDTCNLNCVFCSVKNRERRQLSMEVIEAVLDNMPTLLGVEITGGGDPTMYPHINEVIDTCKRHRLDLGMITNGIMLMRNVDVEKLTWVRVSLNSLDYVSRVNLEGFPKHVTLGFSYVLNELTTHETLLTVGEYADRYGAEYVRIVPDCLDLEQEYNFDLSHPKFYQQTKTEKSLKPIAPCRMGFLKPYLNTDGYFYWCSGVCLGERRFPPHYRMGKWDEIDEIWGEQEPFTCNFHKCFWVEHNRLLHLANTPILHEAFL